MNMALINTQYDSLLEAKRSSKVTDSAAATDGTNPIKFDFGGGFTEGNVIIDVTAIDANHTTAGGTTGTKIGYQISLQLSTSATFATGTVLDKCALRLARKVKTGFAPANGDDNISTGRYTLPFNNENNGTIYRYARIYTRIFDRETGKGITYSAYLGIH